MNNWHTHFARWLAGVATIAVLAGMTACGVTSSGTTTVAAVGAGNTPTATSATTTPTAPSATGCPLTTQSVQWPSAANQVVTIGTASSTQSTAGMPMTIGQTLEVRAAFGHVWFLGTVSPSGIVHADTPSGYGDATTQTCVWHFTATGTGTVTLEFTERTLCTAGMKCTQVALVIEVPVTVK